MKYLALLVLLVSSASFGFHSGPPQPESSDLFAGKFKCKQELCGVGGFETYTAMRPRVMAALNCDGGGGTCQLGVNPFVLAHVKIMGEGEFHVRYHVTNQPGGGYYLESYSITSACEISWHATINIWID